MKLFLFSFLLLLSTPQLSAATFRGLARTQNCYLHKISDNILLTAGHCVQASGKIIHEFAGKNLTVKYGEKFSKEKELKIVAVEVHPTIAPSDKIVFIKSITEISDLAVVQFEGDFDELETARLLEKTPDRGNLTVSAGTAEALEPFTRELLSVEGSYLFLKPKDTKGAVISVVGGNSGGGMYVVDKDEAELAAVTSIRDPQGKLTGHKISAGGTNVCRDSESYQWLLRFIEQ